MPPQIPPLDEQEYDSPLTLRELPGGTLNSDSIIWYFMSSPFFDPMNCINVALHRDLLRTPEEYILSNRQMAEERMRTKYPTGVQYVVVGEPQGEGQPWVIQRQNKVRNDNSGAIDILVEGTWYTQGTKILMAPSLLDIVQARLLSVSTRIQEMFELSKNLSHWSPATGHTYIPPSYEPPKAATTSRMGSRMGSRISSPVLAATDPDMPASSQTQGQVPAAASQSTDPGATTMQFSDDLFMASLRLTNAFGHEYMDENPLQGEPGSFVFTNTNAAVDARHKAQAQAAQAAQASQQSSQPGGPGKIESQSTAPSVAPTPKGIATPATAEAQSRKGSVASLPKGVKEKRRKSKGLTSPTTPTVP